jgi:hypothetical protein
VGNPVESNARFVKTSAKPTKKKAKQPPAKLTKDWSMNLGNGGKVGANTYPAKFSFGTSSANCGTATTPDFVVFNTGLPGSGTTQPTIIAYDNLYSGCSGTIPSVYWQFNTAYPQDSTTGDGSSIVTSVVLSEDGSQVAFVQSNSSNVASLVILKWAAGSSVVAMDTASNNVTPSNYRSSCTAPCMTRIVFSGSPNDTNSAPFYDYLANDTLYVGDNNGHLHEFTGVFKGTPAEVTSSPWPVAVSTGDVLTDPVYDFTSGNVYVGDSSGVLNQINSSGSVTKSGQLGTGTGVVDGPVVDSSAEEVYVFVGSDHTGTNSGVYQVPISGGTITSNTLGTEAAVGAESTTVPLYAGTPDNAYFSSPSSSSPTGNLYVCGNAGAEPTLYRIVITSNVMDATAQAGPALTTATTTCSPVTEILNPGTPVNAPGGTDWIFLSVENSGAPAACSGGGCVMNFAVTPWLPDTAYTFNSSPTLEPRILDSNFNIEGVFNNGTSGSTMPKWSTGLNDITNDGSSDLSWENYGPPPFAVWQAHHDYQIGDVILDSNGNLETADGCGSCESGSTEPKWPQTIGGETSDSGVFWITEPASLSFAQAEAGGTSGIVIDNTSTGTGASQIYFSTLSNQSCSGAGGVGTGTGGCAIQASQASP